MPKDILFPTSVVGSLPRPKFLQDFIWNNGDQFSDFVNDAVRFVIHLQEQAGLDFISDGEWRRKSYIDPISKITESFSDFKSDAEPWRHLVTKKIQYSHPGHMAKEAEFLVKNTKKKTKVAVPSPYLIGQRCWDEYVSCEVYKYREDFIEAVVPILQQELLLLADTNVNVIQLDDPHICLLADEKVRNTFKDPDKELYYACELVNEVIKPLKEKNVEIALHLCRRNKGRQGWIGTGDYVPLVSGLLNLNVHQLVLEYTLSVAGDYSALERLGNKFRIGFGCVDCRFEHIDTVEEIFARVENALNYLSKEKIILNPDCGFAPGSQRLLSLDEPYLKLKNEVSASHILRGKYT